MKSSPSRASKAVDSAYAWGIWPIVTAHAPIIFLAPYLNHITGASIALLGLISTFGRIYDAAYDPFMGMLSDRVRLPGGRRRPWVVLGMVAMLAVMLACLPVLHHPPARLSAPWLIFGLFLFFTAWTTAFIPYVAQAGEITTDYDRRNRINLRQGLIQITAGLVVYLAPYVLVDPDTLWLRQGLAHALPGGAGFDAVVAWLTGPAAKGVANYGRVINVLIWMTALTLPIVLWRYLAKVPDTRHPVTERHGSVLKALSSPMFLTFCLGYLLLIAGYMGRLSLFPFVVLYACGGKVSFLLLMIVQSVSGILATPLWSRLFMRLERVQALMIAAGCEAAGLLLVSLSGADTSFMAIIGFALIGLPGGTLYMLPYLMAGDAADYTLFRRGADNRGVHIAIISMILKLGSVFSSAGLWVAGVLGFNPATGVGPHDILVLKAIGLYLPAGLILAGGLIMMAFPITRRRHRAIQGRLDRRRRAPAPLEALVEAG